jgi:DNA-binding transcriptional MerR regulator
MRFSIGEFSRITALSIKTLRLYHEKGILVPAQVDRFSGYRYYDDTNHEVAQIIKILKSYDFSLAEIKAILSECSEEQDIVDYLRMKLTEIQAKADRYVEISQSIELIIQAQRESNMHSEHTFDIEEKVIDTVLVAEHRMKGKYRDVGQGLGLLAKKLGRHINGKPLTLYYDGEYKEEDADFEPCFPIRKGIDREGISVRELKGGKAISLIHKGPYTEIGNAYKKIFGYLTQKELKTLLPFREVYLKGPGMIFKGNPKNYLTEIQMLIES